MYLELAFGPPPFASPLAVECLGMHYTYSLLCQPQTSVMRLSDGDVLNCNAYAATNEEVDSVMCFPWGNNPLQEFSLLIQNAYDHEEYDQVIQL